MSIPNSQLGLTQILRVDFPQKMHLFDELVYLRYETGYESYRSRLAREKFSEVSYVTIRLSLQKSLLGRITPNLRRVVVWKNGEAFTVYFYYDKSPTTQELILEKLVEADLREDFAAFEQPIKTNIETVPFPGKFPKFEGAWCVYARHE